MTSSGLEVNPTDDAWAFRSLFNIARNHYVIGRVCLVNAMIESGCLLAQQSIEVFLKGIAHATNVSGRQLYYFAKHEDSSQSGKTRIWGHDLTDLVRALLPDNSTLDALISERQLASFLDKLTKSYEPLRYGEATHSAQFEVLVQQLDKTIQILDNLWHEKLNIRTKTRLYVPRSLQADFLHENRAFSKPKISGFSMANLMMGMDLSTMEKEFNFDNRKVRQQASAVMSNKKKPDAK